MNRITLALLASSALATPAGAQIFSMGTPVAPSQQTIITTTGGVAVPSNWHSTANDIYVFGSCGRGGHSLANTYAGGSAGCGTFVHKHNVALTPGSTIQAQVSQGDDTLTTWLKNNAGTKVLEADYGRSASGQTGGAGGTCGASTGDDCHAGGAGVNGLSGTTENGTTGGGIGTLAGDGLAGKQPTADHTISPPGGTGCGSPFATQGSFPAHSGLQGIAGAGVMGNGQGLGATSTTVASVSSHCAGGPPGYPADGFVNALDGGIEYFFTNGALSIGPKGSGGAAAAGATTLGTPGNGSGAPVLPALDEAGGAPTPGFIVLVNAPFAPITLGNVVLTGLQANSAQPVIENASATQTTCAVTRVLTDDLGRTVTIGYQPQFGGSIGCVTPHGYGSPVDDTNIVDQGGGRNWSHSNRDDLHGGYWNPTLAGCSFSCGTPTYIDTSGAVDTVREVAFPLFQNNSAAFNENQAMYPDDGFSCGGTSTCPDDDLIAESPITGGNLTQDSELRSELDDATAYKDITAGHVAGLQTDTVQAFLRNPANYPPGAIQQFNNPAMTTRANPPGQLVYQPQFTVSNISLNYTSLATNMDGSAWSATHGFRLTPAASWPFVAYSVNHVWYVTASSTDSGDSVFDCPVSNDNLNFKYTNNHTVAVGGQLPFCSADGGITSGVIDGGMVYAMTNGDQNTALFTVAIQYDPAATLNANNITVYNSDGTVCKAAENREARQHITAGAKHVQNMQVTVVQKNSGLRSPIAVAATSGCTGGFEAASRTVNVFFGDSPAHIRSQVLGY